MVAYHRDNFLKWLAMSMALFIGAGAGVSILVPRVVENGNQATLEVLNVLFVMTAFVAIVAFLASFRAFARAKGYADWIGLVGAASLVGLLILILLPDRRRFG